jgi:hypothetical protein
MATHWHSNVTRVIKWTKAIAAVTLLVASTGAWGQVDITSEVRTLCGSTPQPPKIILRSPPPVQGKNSFEFVGSGPTVSGGFRATQVSRVSREVVGGHTTIVRARLLYSPVIVQGQNESCFTVDIRFENPGTNTVVYIAELADFNSPNVLVSTAQTRADFEVPLVTYPAPTLSSWALVLLAVLAAGVGAVRLKRSTTDAI